MAINDAVAHFLQARKIDSYQKLRVLLFMYQYPHLVKDCRQLAEQLYLGDTPLLENVLADLRQVGLLKHKEECCKLSDEPEVHIGLQHLNKLYNDPVTRQKLLQRIKSQPFNDPYRQQIPNDVEDHGS